MASTGDRRQRPSPIPRRRHDGPDPNNRPAGRGAASNPANRFEAIHLDHDPEYRDDAEGPSACGGTDAFPDATTRAPTHYRKDPSRTVVARNESPDVGFDRSVNPYRGCEHGCIYCFARPTHEYLGLSAGLDFETQILVKQRAPALLRDALMAPSWIPQVVALSGVTDPYQPVERRLEITRRCLEVLLEFRNPVQIITKSRLVARDCDVLGALAREGCAAVAVSVTTLDPELQRAMEPRAPRPGLRLEAIERLAEAGVPVGVMIGPVLPGLTEHEIPGILAAASRAGASFAGYTLLRLPHAVKELFIEWLERHVPDRRDKVLHRIQALRAGQLNDPHFHTRQRGEGVFAVQIEALFALARRRAGLDAQRAPLRTDRFRRPGDLFSEAEIGPTLRRRGQ